MASEYDHTDEQSTETSDRVDPAAASTPVLELSGAGATGAPAGEDQGHEDGQDGQDGKGGQGPEDGERRRQRRRGDQGDQGAQGSQDDQGHQGVSCQESRVRRDSGRLGR